MKNQRSFNQIRWIKRKDGKNVSSLSKEYQDYLKSGKRKQAHENIDLSGNRDLPVGRWSSLSSRSD